MQFKVRKPYYDNDFDAFIPELWANEVLALLVERMISPNLVYRNYEDVIARRGDKVNIPKPAVFEAVRKGDTDNVTVQDATSTTIQVPLDHHPHTSFKIEDGAMSMSMYDLMQTYMMPAADSLARYWDRVVLGQYPRFISNAAGGIDSITVNSGVTDVLALRQIFEDNLAPSAGRSLLLNPATETTLLSIPNLYTANTVGDGGDALANARLGRKMGFDTWSGQNVCKVPTGNTVDVTMTVNNTAGYGIGDTVLTVADYTGAVSNNMWLFIEGEEIPHYITAHSETLSNTTSITLNSGLKSAVADDAVITLYTPGAINEASGYAAGYYGPLTVSGFTVAPKKGQAVILGIGSSPAIYTIIDTTPTTTSITLDRPLESAVSNADKVNIGTKGVFNFAFNRMAMALVIRPLALPGSGLGVRSAVVRHPELQLAIRVTATYNGLGQYTLVTMDMLGGIQVLYEELGGILVG